MRRGVGLAAAFTIALLIGAIGAPVCSASTGVIRAKPDPSLEFAAVQDLSVAYDGCSIEQPECSWQATATLVPSMRAPCPSTWSSLSETLEHPPGLPPPPRGTPYLPTRKVWSAESSGNVTLSSGPLRVALGGVNDYSLCLYAQHFYPPTEYVPHLPGEADLVASQLLDVPVPPAQPPAGPGKRAAKKRCRSGKHRVLVGGKKKCRKGSHRHHG